MTEKKRGPKIQFNDLYHVTLRKMVAESRAKKAATKTIRLKNVEDAGKIRIIQTKKKTLPQPFPIKTEGEELPFIERLALLLRIHDVYESLLYEKPLEDDQLKVTKLPEYYKPMAVHLYKKQSWFTSVDHAEACLVRALDVQKQPDTAFDMMKYLETKNATLQFLHEQVKPVLNDWIQRGFSVTKMISECKEAEYSDNMTISVIELYEFLSSKNESPEHGTKRIKFVLVDKEKAEDLEQKWISCMEYKSGKPGLDGKSHDAEPFDTAVQQCTFTIYRHTGEQPPETAFNHVKQFWMPGYWSEHEEPEETPIEQPKQENSEKTLPFVGGNK